MEYPKEYPRQDELRIRFTAWMGKLMYHTRLNYLTHAARHKCVGDIESLPYDLLIREDTYDLGAEEDGGFAFEEEKLSRAIRAVPLKRKQVLTMLFVRRMSPEEISCELGCKVDYVYKLKSLALDSMKELLKREGYEYD